MGLQGEWTQSQMSQMGLNRDNRRDCMHGVNHKCANNAWDCLRGVITLKPNAWDCLRGVITLNRECESHNDMSGSARLNA